MSMEDKEFQAIQPQAVSEARRCPCGDDGGGDGCRRRHKAREMIRSYAPTTCPKIRAQGPRLARSVDRRNDAGRRGRPGRGLDRNTSVGSLPKECQRPWAATLWERWKKTPASTAFAPVS